MLRIEESTTARSVLVVDEEREPREAIHRALEPRFRVITADSGEQAIRVLRERQVDVVTLDSMMRGMSATETLRKIRDLDSDVQIVIASARSVDDLAPPPILSAYAWVAKPFDAEMLLETVAKAAEETRAGRLRSEQTQLSALREARLRSSEVEDKWQHDAARMFSHEIKNRLSVVVGFVRLLREGRMDPGHAENALDVIEGNAHEAATLAVNFLHAEESDGGWIQLHKTSASLNEIVAGAMEGETPRARLRHITLDADFEAALPAIDLDVAMISRAVTNLLNNAVHYSPEGTRVDVQTRRSTDGMIVKVRDHGPGISAGQVPRLFERYARGSEAASASSTGLGLYLVRRIMEAHGGSVSATFPPEGGSAFELVLPLPRNENA